ncbi:MAG: phosphate ABC transporter permease subunit PstC, partial [Betaproteobacteria bacterium]|nr:phosphate ABC transporter permease subunit PstC [Betaproteobacteria bacterium]
MSRPFSDTHLKRQHLLDLAFRNITKGFAFLVLVLLAGIVLSLFLGSLPAIKAFGPGFLFSSEWNPVTQKFGALVPIFGTLATSII